MGAFLESGEVSIRLSNGVILTVPPEQFDCVDGDDFVDVDENVDTPINILEASEGKAFGENVDLLIASQGETGSMGEEEKIVSPSPRHPVSSNLETDLESQHNSLPPSSRLPVTPSSSMNQTKEITPSPSHLITPSPSMNQTEETNLSPNWDTFPMHNCRSPQEIALELKELLLQCYREGRILEAVQSFSQEAISWVVNHLIEPAPKAWLQNVIQST